MNLVLVRHAAPQVDPDTAAAGWPLSARGLAAATALARHGALDGVGRVLHSPEPKAAQTAAAIGAARRLTCEPVSGLGEVRRPAAFVSSEQREAEVAAYLAGSALAGWEPYAAAQARICGAIRSLLRAAGPSADAVAIVSHGLILTLFCSALFGERLRLAEWRSIAMPDLCLLDLAAGCVRCGFFAGRRIRVPLEACCGLPDLERPG